MDFITTFQYITHKLGLSIRPYKPSTHSDIRLIRTLEHFKINLVLDIGANIGQYGEMLYNEGYQGEVISFEPINSCHEILQKKAKSNPKWKVAEPMAIGENDYETEINISKNLVSSSILKINDKHIQGAPNSAISQKQTIKVKKLDSIEFDFSKNIFLKIDTQGFEKNVLNGAKESLKKIHLVSVEISLVELYENAGSWLEIIDFMDKSGFYLYGLETAFVDNNTGQVLQIDGIFARK